MTGENLNQYFNKKVNTIFFKKIFYLFRLLICISLLSYIFIKFDFVSIFHRLKEAKVIFILPALLLFYIGILLSALKWKIALQLFDRRHTILSLFSLYTEAGFFNLFFPGVIAGDVSRIAHTSKKKITLEDIYAVFFERFSGLLTLCLYIGFFALVGRYSELGSFSNNALRAIILLTFLGFLMLLNVRVVKQLTKFLPAFISRTIQNLSEKLRYANRTVIKHPNQLCLIIGLSILFIFSMVFTAYFITRSIKLFIPIDILFTYVPLIALFLNIPISISGIGARENIFLLVYSSFGFLSEDIIAFALLQSSLLLMVNLSGGIILLLRNTGISKKKFWNKKDVLSCTSISKNSEIIK